MAVGRSRTPRTLHGRPRGLAVSRYVRNMLVGTTWSAMDSAGCSRGWSLPVCITHLFVSIRVYNSEAV